MRRIGRLIITVVAAILGLGGMTSWLHHMAKAEVLAVTGSISANAVLGRVVTTTVVLSNRGQPAATATLYEGWDNPAVTTAAERLETPLRVPVPDHPDGPLSSTLLEQLNNAPDGRADMLVYLNDQADLAAAAAPTDWNERGWAVMNTLQAYAAQTQAPLIAELRARRYEPHSYWIVNALAVRGDRAAAEWLASQSSVALVAENTIYQLSDSVETEAASGAAAWGVKRVRAPQAWAEWGAQGSGIVVANIDTGVSYTHTALLNAYRGWSPQGVTHDYNWYDPARKNPFQEPTDTNGHGTHTMGTLVGGLAADGMALGVAPSARWIAARGCESFFCSNEALIASAQWILAPTDRNLANPRPDLRPHIVNNSWGDTGEENWYLGYAEAWNAAGIFSVFANGNNGALFGCHTSSVPGSYAAAFSVGATDAEDFIADFSSRGPTSDGRIKPDISAPGVSVPSAWPDGSVMNLSGTSMATPHVAGAAALLWSANPALIGNLSATRQLLTANAFPRAGVECGDAFNAVPNNLYGWGRLDVYRALQAARVDVPWLSLPLNVSLPHDGVMTVTVTLDARQVPGPGAYTARILMFRNSIIIPIPVTLEVTPSANIARLTGQLRDRWTGGGMYGHLAVASGPLITTNATGQYSVTLPAGTYALTATALGYLPDYGSLSALTDTTRLITLTADAPHLQISPPVLSATLPFGAQQTTVVPVVNAGPRPLTVAVSVPPLEWSVTGPGATSLFNMSAFAPLPLGDDMVYINALTIGFSLPVYGQWVDKLYLSSNGWVSLTPPSASVQSAACLPGGDLPPGSLAGFWTDLDPSQGGAVRAGKLNSTTYVISWENVPPWRETPDPSGPTFTFQIVLRANGWAEYRYGAMGNLPWRWGVGMLGGAGRGHNLACYKGGAPQSLTGQRWQMKNQPTPGVWLSGSPTTFTVPPYGTANLNVTLSGLGFVPWRIEPFEAVARLATNDPLQPQADLPAQVKAGPPAAVVWLPLIGR